MKGFRLLYIAGLLLLSPCALLAQSTAGDELSKLDFQTYLKEVGTNNLHLLAERYQVDIAQAEIAASRVMPDPELTFEGEHENFSVELGYTLELGKRGARIRSAKTQREWAELELEAYFQDLRAEATHAFLDAILQRDLLEVKRNSYVSMLELHRSDSIRYALGEITLNDARQSRVEAATLLNEVYEQEAAYKSALVLLNRYMGKRIGTMGQPVGEFASLRRSYELHDLMEVALQQRIDVLLAHKGIEVAQNQLKLARAERRTDLGLMLGYSRDWHGVWPNRHAVKAGVTIPLKFSNINKGVIRSSQLAVEQNHLLRESKEMDTQVEVSQAFFQYEATQKQVDQYVSGLLDEAKEVLQGMVYRYKRGETSILEVLMAQRTYNEVQEQYLAATKAYASALVNLEYTCGIWDIDL